jgi:exoenzyme U
MGSDTEVCPTASADRASKSPMHPGTVPHPVGPAALAAASLSVAGPWPGATHVENARLAFLRISPMGSDTDVCPTASADRASKSPMHRGAVAPSHQPGRRSHATGEPRRRRPTSASPMTPTTTAPTASSESARSLSLKSRAGTARRAMRDGIPLRARRRSAVDVANQDNLGIPGLHLARRINVADIRLCVHTWGDKLTMSGTLTQQQWIDRVLGVSVARPAADTAATPPKKVTFMPSASALPPPPSAATMAIGQGQPPSGAPIKPAAPTGEPKQFTGANGKSMTIAKGPDGRVSLTAPPPPIQEITFSGGGGKGAALPGAVRALEQSDVLKDLKVVTGASVGSMTAALVAAGITAKEFETVANDDATGARITEGTGGTKLGMLKAAMSNRGSPLTGQGLEDTVRDVLDETLRKRMLEYVQQVTDAGGKPDPAVVAIAKRLSGNKAGPTFADYRTLSKVIPAIKEVSMSGTYKEEIDPATHKPIKNNKDVAQLYMFNADNEPDMEVAKAVHASASFPGAFKPVDLMLSFGIMVRFIDGGVMNNAPTTESTGVERDLDPVPTKSSITFVFEDEDGKAQQMLNGDAKPASGLGAKIKDWIVGADNAAGDHATARALADRPDQIVVVPLKFTMPQTSIGKKAKELDMRGTMNGTLAFNTSLVDKLVLQDKTMQVTNDHLKKQQAPQTREFASEDQMFMSLTRDDLAALDKDGMEGAAAALEFRDKVTAILAELSKKSDEMTGDAEAKLAADPIVKTGLSDLEKLSAGNVDYQGFVAREINRGKLDRLLEAVRKGGGKSDVLSASFAASDAIIAHDRAVTVLNMMIYPKMKDLNPDGAGGQVLMMADAILRKAKSPDDVNDALTMVIDHFKSKPDRTGRHGHKKFATDLQQYVMKAA